MTAERDRAGVKRALLNLLSANSPAPIVLDDAGWAGLVEIAQQHLLEPLLHHRITERDRAQEIPAHVMQKFSFEYRASAMRALVLQGTLHRVDSLLRQHGIAYAALKGARLAWHAYPHPALRPMRDIDILVRPDEAVRAHRLLLENGCRRYADQNRPDSLTMTAGKHLSPIEDEQSGIRIEVHLRLFEVGLSQNSDATLMQADDLLDRRIVQEFSNMAVSVLPAEEALLHCIVHAIYDSRFTSGPILLSDVKYLLCSDAIDWRRFWALAEEGGWVPGSILALRLAEEIHGPQAIQWTGSGGTAPSDEVLESFAFALMSDLSAKRDMFIQTNDGRKRGASARVRYFGQLLFPAKHQLKDFGRITSDSPLVWLLYPVWLLSRIVRFLGNLGNRHHRSDISEVKRVMGWLKSKAD
ncbi:MAG: nucleotidyltransferase family protein [Sphingomonadaceae bacterium]|nr:nucleotidyltransferase family protein [Sphingomonadaceae bacterium]